MALASFYNNYFTNYAKNVKIQIKVALIYHNMLREWIEKASPHKKSFIISVNLTRMYYLIGNSFEIATVGLEENISSNKIYDIGKNNPFAHHLSPNFC